MSSYSGNHWTNYQNQIKKYLVSVNDNPYYNELVNDFKKENLTKITKYLSDEYRQLFTGLINNNKVSEEWIDIINATFTESNKMTLFCKFLEENYSINDVEKINSIIKPDNLNNIRDKIRIDIPENVFKPTELKFVTTTGIAYLTTSVNYQYLYEQFIPKSKIIKYNDGDDIILDDDVVGTVIGCKTGNLPVKGYFSKEQSDDFFNSATINVAITNSKCANVKLFGNGKLQITGIQTPEMGHKTVDIVCDLIKSIPNNKEKNITIVPDKKDVALKNYNTVMINTCYELGIGINREILYDIIVNRYELNAIYDSDGYPGVRIQYFYNKNNLNTIKEGRCVCSPSCNGKGTGDGNNNCRRLSVAIFQSGSVIIAGGCQNVDPILSAYKFINNIIGEIANEIKKIDCSKKKKSKRKKKTYYISKTKLLSINTSISSEEYTKLIALKL